MSSYKFSYSGIDQLKLDVADRPYYMHFSMMWRDTGEVLATIITDRRGCGRWVEHDGVYQQVEGIYTYTLPKTPMGVRKALRIMALDALYLRHDLAVTERVESPLYPIGDEDMTAYYTELDAAYRAAEKDPVVISERKRIRMMIDEIESIL